MSTLSSSFTPFTNPRAFAGPTVNSGVLSGNVFDGRGNDFLSPNDILGSVNDFSGTISPGSNSSILLLGPNPINQNADPTSVLNSTNGAIGNIFSSGFGSNLFGPSASLNRDLANFNPLSWQDPNAVNVLFGTMDATNKIFGGNGLFQPNFVPPLFPFVPTPSAPFGNWTNSLIPQAQLFPNTFFSGSPYFQSVGQGGINPTQIRLAILQLQAQIGLLQKDISDLQLQRTQVLASDQTGAEDKARVQARAAELKAQIDQKTAQLGSAQQLLTQLQVQAQFVQAGSFQSQATPVAIVPIGFNAGRPFGLASGTSVFPFQSQMALMGQLAAQNQQNSVFNGLTINQLAMPNGVPAWIA